MPSALGAWLREQRQNRGWPIPEMARQLRQAARASGDTLPASSGLQRNIRRWESGQGSVSERYRLHYCAALGIGAGQFGPSVPPPPPQKAAAAGPGPAAQDTTAGQGPGERPAGPEPSAFLGSPREQLLAIMAEESQELGEWAGRSDVADATINQIAAQVRHLALDYARGAPLPLLLEARRLRDRVASRLRGHQRLTQARDLYLMAAEVCGLLAWMTSDLGSHRAAAAHAWTAWMCAGQAGHDPVLAWVRVTQAKLAYWDGRYAESAQMAEDGLRYRRAGSAGVFLALLQARSLASAGQREEARRALRLAADEREKTTGPDLVGGLWSLTPARYHALAASTYLLLADPAGALSEASQAIMFSRAAPAAEQNYGAEMHAHIDQALAHLQQPDLDGAAAALLPVLRLAAESRYDTLAQHLAAARPLLTRPALAHSAAALGMLEQISAYAAAVRPAGALPVTPALLP